MAKAAKLPKEEKQEEVILTPELVEENNTVVTEPELVIEEIQQPEHTVEVTPEPVLKLEVIEEVPEQKEIKESDEIGFLYTIMDTMESGGWGKALHPMIKSRIEYLRSK